MQHNLVIIHTDEHNFRTLGCYRDVMTPDQAMVWGPDAKVDTPHIDRLAKEGALCTSFYATSPVCSPSRASFMSGKYAQNTGVPTNNLPLNDDIVTFAELLKRQGYATGYIGKWHLDGPGKPQWEPKRKFGFDDNRYMYNRGHWKQLEDTADGPRVKARNENDEPVYVHHGADEKSFTTDFLTDRTVEFIDAHKEGPFCCLLSIPDPHGPNTVRAPYDTMFNDMKFDMPRTWHRDPAAAPSWAAPDKRQGNMAQYFGMVKCIDDNVGKLLGHLEKNGLMDKTIIVFTSDHGDFCYEHHRQEKGRPMEASAKVPFVIRYPEKVRPGTVVSPALSTADFLPTILALMEVPTAGQEEGRDASGFFNGNAPAVWDDVTFSRSISTSTFKWLSAITARYKLVLSETDEPWLIDLETDPDELKNFAGDPVYHDIVSNLAEKMLSYGKTYNDPWIQLPGIRDRLTRLTGKDKQTA